MSKFFKKKVFNIGFVLGFILFAFVQLACYINYAIERERFSHLPTNGVIIDVIWQWGLPFPNYYWGEFFIAGIIGNIIVAIFFSFILGLIFKFVWLKIAGRKLK